MRTLVSEAAPGEAAEVIQRLRAAGHTVVTCRGGNRCPMVLGEPCPLADDVVDVAVHVRERPRPLSEHDRPFMCAVVAAVPTVLCGPVPGGSQGPWPRADIWCQPAGVVPAVAKATRVTTSTARRRVTQAVNDVLRPHGLAGPHRLRVSTADAVIDVELLFEARVPVRVREQLRATIRAALAALTPNWDYARVQIHDSVPADAGERDQETA